MIHFFVVSCINSRHLWTHHISIHPMPHFNETRYESNEPITTESPMLLLLSIISRHKEWVIFFFFGGILESCRSITHRLWNNLFDCFFTTAVFEDQNACYYWMMAWLDQQPGWVSAREVEVTTSLDLTDSGPPRHIFKSLQNTMGSLKICYRPVAFLPLMILYHGRILRVSRSKDLEGSFGRKVNTLTISIFSRDRAILDQLMVEAQQNFTSSLVRSVCVFTVNKDSSTPSWYLAAKRPKRSIDSIVLDPGIKDLLLNDARDFLANKEWYNSRGIPFRRGYLLYGEPGSGKTSLIHSLAGELGLHMYIISLSDRGLDDTNLRRLISDMPERSILLMEDIDVAMYHGLTRDRPTDSERTSSLARKALRSSSEASNNITLSGLLNALDGVAAQEGRILFATTNKYSALDPALCRPGRMDLHIEFKNASRGQAAQLFKHFFSCTFNESDTNSGEDGEGLVDAIFAKSPTTTSTGTGAVLSGSLVINSDKIPGLSNDNAITGRAHTDRGPMLSDEELQNLADSFAAAIPERIHSMASLQGYLMLYKSRPFEAVQGAAAWADKEKTAKERQTNSTPNAVDLENLANGSSVGVPNQSYLGSVSRFIFGDALASPPF